MNYTPAYKWIIVLVTLVTTAQLYAQEDKIAAAPSNRWGIRLELSGNESAPSLTTPIGVTFKHNKHQFYGGLILTPFDATANSPLYGGGLSYQYFLLRDRRLFNPFAYASLSAGRYTTDQEVEFFYPQDTTFVRGKVHRSSLSVSAVIGLGFEIRLGKHCYGNLAGGIGTYYRYRTIEGTFTEPSDKTPPKIDDAGFTDLEAEVRIGLGYRF